MSTYSRKYLNLEFVPTGILELWEVEKALNLDDLMMVIGLESLNILVWNQCDHNKPLDQAVTEGMQGRVSSFMSDRLSGLQLLAGQPPTASTLLSGVGGPPQANIRDPRDEALKYPHGYCPDALGMTFPAEFQGSGAGTPGHAGGARLPTGLESGFEFTTNETATPPNRVKYPLGHINERRSQVSFIDSNRDSGISISCTRRSPRSVVHAG